MQIKMSEEDMTVVCTIIASAEYCSEVVGALGRNVSKTLEAPYNDQVYPPLPSPKTYTPASRPHPLTLKLDIRIQECQAASNMPWASFYYDNCKCCMCSY